jgi:putative Mg2+ transporter-C (MgtC) family protein
MDFSIATLRILLTFIASVVFGINRQRAHKPIGFGTYPYVATGACAVAIVGITLVKDNPLGLLSSVITGIGFLGAGALIRNNDKTFGFTTAAGLWLFAIFGLIIGSGEYALGTLIYSVIWSIVLFDHWLESKAIGFYQKKMTLKVSSQTAPEQITQLLTSVSRYKLIHVHVNKKESSTTYMYHVEGTKAVLHQLPHLLSAQDWFESCIVE